MPSPWGHALAGVAAAWTADLLPGFRPWRVAPPTAPLFQQAGGVLTLTCAGLAVLPDLDLAFRAHRSLSHSVSAVALITILAAAVTAQVTRLPPWRVAAMCGAAYATHIVLDWLGVDHYPPYGIQALWPFSDRWFLSGLDIFVETERRSFLSMRAIRINLFAMAWETMILLPIVAVLWLVRVKALARLPTQLPRRDHAAQ